LSAAPTSRASAGAIVDVSTHSVPGAAPAATPSSPRRSARTWAPSTTMVNTASTPAAASAGLAATVAPCSAANASARSRVRLKTVRSWPARRRLAAIGAPMMPSPRNPTRAMAGS
jgi:hypothetical protein